MLAKQLLVIVTGLVIWFPRLGLKAANWNTSAGVGVGASDLNNLIHY